MLFNSLSFIGFFAVVLALHSLPFSWRVKKANLLVASYLFYAAWNPPFVLLIWISTLVDWYVAKGLNRVSGRRTRRLLLLASLGCNLGLLAFFKYGGFVLDNFVLAVQALGWDYAPAAPSIVLPVGISFYTFQTLSYTIDVYRGEARPWKSFLDFALFVTFFPQLVAGPIVRAVDFLPQCIAPRRASAAQLSWGLSLLTLGLFEKVAIADALLGPIADKVFSGPSGALFGDAWLGTFAFAGQIFCDFAGYSTCAIGVALCLGFAIPDNFNFPYAAVGFSDFWRRWHISLSTWLRDYLYISLGGNRGGALRTLVNLAATMLLGGLWHGANWTFVAWGGLHGLYLVAERLLTKRLGGRALWAHPAARAGLAVLTYLCVCIAWVFFRAQDFGQAAALLRAMFGCGSESAWPLLKTTEAAMVAGLTLFILLLHGAMRNTSLEEMAQRLPWWLRAGALAAMLAAIVTMPGDDRAFIYFQF